MPKPPDDLKPRRLNRNAHQSKADLITRRKRAAERKAMAAEQAHQEHIAGGYCSALTKRGTFCKWRSVTTGENDFGDEGPLCEIHSKDTPHQRELARRAKIIRKQRQAKPHELMRMIIESNPIAFMQPYLDALGIRIVYIPDDLDPEILHPTAVVDPASLGTTLFGVSKDGDVVVSRHKDIEAQQRAAERLFDRVYGKPKQTNIIAGGESTSEPNIVPFDEKRQAEVAAILEAARRPSHLNPHSNN
jgi:hypothetical protein